MSTSAVKLENETVVAFVPNQKVDEVALTKAVTAVELKAESILIETDEDYSAAAEFGRMVKQKAAEVTDFFRPMKEDAHKAHKTICDREKTMLQPLTKAESTLKRTMGDYVLRKERERQAMEEAVRKQAQAEADRKLEEAVRQEQAGNTRAAESSLLDAQMADSMSRNMQVSAPMPKADGVSTAKDWEIIAIEDGNVPVTLAGMMLRPVDQKAVLKLIRTSKGTIQIPGITYRDTVKTSIRR